MTSQHGSQTTTIHILPNISRSKDNQTIKFSHVIEYDMRNIFRQISFRKRGRETSSGLPFLFENIYVR